MLRSSLKIQDFDGKDAWLAHAVIDKIIEIIFRLKPDENSVYQYFMEMAKHDRLNLPLPLLPQEAWDRLSAELYE